VNHSFLTFLIYALCVYRLTHLVTADKLTDGIREWLRVKSHEEQFRNVINRGNESTEWRDAPKRGVALVLWTLMTCSWCSSVWVALIVVPMGLNYGWWIYVCDVFAFSAAAGLISEKV
jgi:hypothetical protein